MVNNLAWHIRKHCPLIYILAHAFDLIEMNHLSWLNVHCSEWNNVITISFTVNMDLFSIVEH